MKQMKNRRQQATQGTGGEPGGISREPSFILIALFLALGAYIGLAAIFMPPSVTTSPTTKLFLPRIRAEIRPEPQERFLYVFGLCCIPTMPTLFYWLLIRCHDRFINRFRWLENRKLIIMRDILVVGIVLYWLWFLSVYSEIPRVRLLLALTCVAALLLLLVMRWEACRWSYVVCGR